MSETKKAGFIYFICMLAFVSVRILNLYGAFSFLADWWGDLIITSIIQIGCIFILPLCMYKFFTDKKFCEIFSGFGYKKINLKTFILCVVAGIICYILNIYVASVWNLIIKIFGYNPKMASGTMYNNLFAQFVSTALLPAVCEEFLHRGLMLGVLKKENGYFKSVFIVALLFGLFHMNIYQTGYAFVLGVIMGFFTIYGGILPAVIIHFMNNALNILTAYSINKFSVVKNAFLSFENFIYRNKVTAFIFMLILLIYLTYFLFLIFVYIIKKEKLKNEYKLKEIALAILTDKNKDILQNNQKEILSGLAFDVNKTDITFKDKIFIYLSLFMSALITIFTLIWGIL